MGHLMVLLWALAFGAGITAMASTYQRYRLRPLGFLRNYWQFLVLANVTVGGALLMTYVSTNVPDLASLGAVRSAPELFLVSSFWVVAAFIYKLTVVAFDLLGRRLPVWTRRLLISVLAAAPIGLLAGLALANLDISHEEVFAYSEILNVSLVAAGMIGIIGSLGAAGTLVPASYRLAVRRLLSLHLTAFLLIPVAALLTYPLAWYLLIASFVTSNLTPLVLLGPLLAHRTASPLAEPERGEGLEEFAARHGISEREREIVRLLLNGCTNSEIGTALCISPHTVKNHVYNVYRKVGVRNRVHLANLVRSL